MISVGDSVSFSKVLGVPHGIVLDLDFDSDGNVQRMYVALCEPIIYFTHMVVARDGSIAYHRVN